MKKNIFALAAILVALTGCLKDEPYVNPTPGPDPEPQGSKIKAGEVFFNEFDATNKQFEIYNATASEIDLAKAKITKDGSDEWVVPDTGFKIPAKGFIVIPVKSDGKAGPTFGMSETKGFVYELTSDNGSVDKADNSAPLDLTGLTWGRRTDGGSEWVLFSKGSIGETNANGVVKGEEGKAKVVINEINGNAKYIELFNAGEAEADISGYQIKKDGGVKWTASDESQLKLAAGAYLKLDCVKNSKDPKQVASGISAKSNVQVILLDKDGKEIDRFERGEEGAGWGEIDLPENPEASFSRVPNGSGSWAYAAPTPGAENGAKTGDIEQEPVPVLGIVLNEINGNDKYMELFNAGKEEIDITGYQIKKDGEVKWTASDESQLKLAAGAYLKLDCVKKSTDPKEVASGISAGKNVQVILLDKDGNEVDKFERGVEGTAWGDITLPENTEASFSRVPNGTGEWAYAVPTPGAENGAKTGDIEQE